MDNDDPTKKSIPIDTGGGSYIDGSVDTRGGDFIARDQYKFITVIQDYIQNPAQWQDAIWHALTKHWPSLALLFVLEIGLGAVYMKFKGLYLISSGLWLLTSGLLFVGTLGWYFIFFNRKKSYRLFFTIPVSLAFFWIMGWQAWQIIYPPKFDPHYYGIAVAELGEGPNNNRTARAREISHLVYEQLLDSFGENAARLDLPSEAGEIKLMRIGVIPDSATAQDYGREIQADIVVWGQILTSKENSATIRFEILETPDRAVNPEFPLVLPVGLKSTDVIANISNLEGDTATLSEAINKQTIVIAKSATGLRDFLRRYYLNASRNIEAAINVLESSSQVTTSPEGLSLLYFYTGRAYQGMEQVEHGQKWLLEAHDKNPREPAIPLTLALGYASLGDMQKRDQYLTEAMDLLNIWLQTHPKDPNALFDRGVIYQIYNRHANAVLDFESALQYDPDYYIAYIGLGQSVFKIGDTVKAVDMIKRGINLAGNKNINPSWARLNLALIYEDIDDPELAHQEYQMITTPETEERWFYYYNARFLERQQEMDAALVAYQKSVLLAVESGLGKGWAYGNLAAYLERRGLYQQALDNYLRAVHEAPKDALLHANLGNIYYILGDIEKSEEEYALAIQLGSNIYYVYASYAGVLYQMGNFEAAAPIYEKSLELRPVDHAVLLNLAQTYLNLNQQDKAISIYLHMLEISEQLPEQAVQTARDQLVVLEVNIP
jgi:tetratricopeptide (TPR) repeat protein